MFVRCRMGLWLAVALVLPLEGPGLAADVGGFAGFAGHVLSYEPGRDPSPGFTDAAAAIGSPEPFTAAEVFPGAVSPFNPPFLASQIVSIGEGGQITLGLSHFALPLADGPEIGVLANVGLIDVDGDFSNAMATATETLAADSGTFGIDSAAVQVSQDGQTWFDLGAHVFDIPANGYTDLTDPFSAQPGTARTDFGKPFTGQLADFAGLGYSNDSAADMLDVLDGSGGGKWLDISNTGLERIGFIRFSVADDLNEQTSLNFDLDAVSIANGAVGNPVPEPASILVIGVTAALMWRPRSRGNRLR